MINCISKNKSHVPNWCDPSQTCRSSHVLINDDLIWHHEIVYDLGNLLNYFIAGIRHSLTASNGIFVLTDK